ncbi:MAG: hypothetical protein WCI47_02140 [bacterium]
MPARKKSKSLRHHIRHHVRKIKQVKWKTPHLVIGVLVGLGFGLAYLMYAEATKPALVSTLPSPRAFTSEELNPEASQSVKPVSSAFNVSLGKATVDPTIATGCEGVYNFQFPVTSNGPGSITFKRLRSDMTEIDKTAQTMNFSQAETKTIPYQWQMSPNTEFTGYAYLQVISPKPLISNYASFKFTYLCR